MSVIVKGMEMPKNCRTCPCFQYDMFDDDIDGYCKALETKIMNRSKRHPDCPLIELPPHGRLIDADKFAETLKEVSTRQGYDKLFSDNILSVGDVFDAIAVDLKGEGLDEYKQAPTVIEAEGSETDA